MTCDTVPSTRRDERTVLEQQLCPACKGLVVAPEESQYVREGLIRHVWSCEVCGAGFITLVTMRPQSQSQTPNQPQAPNQSRPRRAAAA